jgi:hypothetical protein
VFRAREESKDLKVYRAYKDRKALQDLRDRKVQRETALQMRMLNAY